MLICCFAKSVLLWPQLLLIWATCIPWESWAGLAFHHASPLHCEIHLHGNPDLCTHPEQRHCLPFVWTVLSGCFTVNSLGRQSQVSLWSKGWVGLCHYKRSGSLSLGLLSCNVACCTCRHHLALSSLLDGIWHEECWSAPAGFFFSDPEVLCLLPALVKLWQEITFISKLVSQVSDASQFSTPLK